MNAVRVGRPEAAPFCRSVDPSAWVVQEDVDLDEGAVVVGKTSEVDRELSIVESCATSLHGRRRGEIEPEGDRTDCASRARRPPPGASINASP